ncbi:MAG: Rv3235 family protein [Candidatus Nanopelagicales bacterium]
MSLPTAMSAIVLGVDSFRSFAQLKRWVSPHQLSLLSLRGQSFSRHPATRTQKGLSRLLKVRGVQAMQVAPGIIEASAVIVGSARSHAIAMRMEVIGNQWLLTAIEMRQIAPQLI